MPRPKYADPPRPVHIQIPGSLHARIELRLFSTVEGKVPYGAWREFAIQAFERHIDAIDNLAKEKASATDS